MSLQGRIVYVVVKWDDYDMREGTLERMQVVKTELDHYMAKTTFTLADMESADKLATEMDELRAEKRRAETNNGYALIGVFTSEQNAIDACETDLHAYTVMVLDHALTSRLFRADDNWRYPLESQQETT